MRKSKESLIAAAILVLITSREELIACTYDGKELRIFSTTIPTKHRIPTLMHDPVYRLGVAWQNVAYNVPAHTGFYLGDGMKEAPRAETATESFGATRNAK